MDDRTRPTGADDTGELSRQHRGRRKAKPHRRRALHVAVLVPLAIASASWAAVSFNTPIREATHSWFPDGYRVAVAPGEKTQSAEPETTATEDSESTAGKQRETTPETTEGRNRVPVTADPTTPADDNDNDGDQRSDDTDDPAPEQPEPTQSKEAPAPPTTAPTAPQTNDPEPQPTVTERPTTGPTQDPGPNDDGDEEEEDGGIIDIDIELPLPLPLVAAPAPEASSTGTNSLVETGIPGAVPGTGQQTSVKVNLADLATWSFILWQSLA